LERLPAAGGIGRDGAEQAPELVRAVAIKLRIGAARKLVSLGKQPRSRAVIPLLEHEHRQTEQAELARFVPDLVDVLLAAVADEDHGVDPHLAPLLAPAGQ